MKQNLPVIILIVSVILIIVNILTTDDFDNGFWMQTFSGALLIIGMLLTIYNKKKTDK